MSVERNFGIQIVHQIIGDEASNFFFRVVDSDSSVIITSDDYSDIKKCKAAIKALKRVCSSFYCKTTIIEDRC